MKKIITIIGARPQIIKSSAISRTIQNHFKEVVEEVIVHTGQHYDENMSAVFFEEMGIPQPRYNLQVGSGAHGNQTARMLDGLEKIYMDEKPDAVLVYGDTNSTLAGALAAVKIHLPVVHVEAGLRSFNKQMPEEINRIACDHMSTMLFTPTASGIQNLIREGFNPNITDKATIDRPKIYHCGDIMFDNSLYFSALSDTKSSVLKLLELKKDGFLLVTVHRDANTDSAENMEHIFTALLEIQTISGLTIVLPIHPRTKNKMKEQLPSWLFERINKHPEFKIIPPAGFLDVIALEKNARMIITDSGGLQKEAYFFKKPCIILRPQTEWVEIVENGNALLADSSRNRIIDSFNMLYEKKGFTYPPFYGDGDAAKFICQKIVEEI